MSQTEVLHLLQLDYGKLGLEWLAVDTSRAILIGDLISGQFENPLRIIEVIPSEGSCRDVSEDIAREVAQHTRDEGETLTRGVLEFVETHAGLAWAREAA